jgi:deaminated glutathione amidase
MKVAALQMVSGVSLEANLARAHALLAQAAAAGAELAALPEHFCLLGARDTDKLAIQEPFGSGRVQQFLGEAARTFGLWIVGGTMPVSIDGGERVRNTSLVFAPSGDCVARYDKIHLFRFDNGRERFDEARVLERGGEPAMAEITARNGRRWRIGLSVCYDLRFPELYRGYAAAGADLLLVPSAFTHTTGQAHWEVLLRARAVENLAYVLAPAQGGTHENGRRTWGHSMLVDPWGEILAEQAEGEAVVLGTLDAERLATYRRQLPALEHRVL